MISKIVNVIPERNVRLNKCKTSPKPETKFLSENKSVAENSPKLQTADKFFDKIKNIIRNMNKFFSEENRSIRAGLKPLKGKDHEKFIRDTSMYDPNSPDYIHANYSVGKKSK